MKSEPLHRIITYNYELFRDEYTTKTDKRIRHLVWGRHIKVRQFVLSWYTHSHSTAWHGTHCTYDASISPSSGTPGSPLSSLPRYRLRACLLLKFITSTVILMCVIKYDLYSLLFLHLLHLLRNSYILTSVVMVIVVIMQMIYIIYQYALMCSNERYSL